MHGLLRSTTAGEVLRLRSLCVAMNFLLVMRTVVRLMECCCCWDRLSPSAGCTCYPGLACPSSCQLPVATPATHLRCLRSWQVLLLLLLRSLPDDKRTSRLLLLLLVCRPPHLESLAQGRELVAATPDDVLLQQHMHIAMSTHATRQRWLLSPSSCQEQFCKHRGISASHLSHARHTRQCGSCSKLYCSSG